ncbi:Diablo, mitochondrial [Gossypium arboreum]|uniref:Diablo, mitochondrial n=1 Tax=Gossypium arboreum TaxID=29729 RepID=A0A0B0PKD3_GOSAR|nr:Diablo, mitochondrial [Gossypium arboreum]
MNFPIMALMSFPLYSLDKLPDRLFMSFSKCLSSSFPLQGLRVCFLIMCPNWVSLKNELTNYSSVH